MGDTRTDVDDVSFLQFPPVRYAMAYDFVDRTGSVCSVEMSQEPERQTTYRQTDLGKSR